MRNSRSDFTLRGEGVFHARGHLAEIGAHKEAVVLELGQVRSASNPLPLFDNNRADDEELAIRLHLETAAAAIGARNLLPSPYIGAKNQQAILALQLQRHLSHDKASPSAIVPRERN